MLLPPPRLTGRKGIFSFGEKSIGQAVRRSTRLRKEISGIVPGTPIVRD